MESQSIGKAMPSRISYPTGVCIQLLGEKNQESRGSHATLGGNLHDSVQPRRHPVPAEEQHPEKRRLQEEGGLDLVADHRPDDVAENGRISAPNCAATE